MEQFKKNIRVAPLVRRAQDWVLVPLLFQMSLTPLCWRDSRLKWQKQLFPFPPPTPASPGRRKSHARPEKALAFRRASPRSSREELPQRKAPQPGDTFQAEKQNIKPRKSPTKKLQIITPNQNNKPKTTPAEQPWLQTSHRSDVRRRWAGCAPGWGSSRTGKSRSK